MTTGALPKTVEVRTLAAREVTISGSLPVDRLPRLSGLIVSVSRPFDVVARCFKDEEARYVLELRVCGAVDVACQRCLTPVTVPVDALSCLAVVWTDDQAAHKLASPCKVMICRWIEGSTGQRNRIPSISWLL